MDFDVVDDVMAEKLQMHAAAATDGDDKMIVDEVNVEIRPSVTIDHPHSANNLSGVQLDRMGEALSSTFSGQPDTEKVKPGEIFRCPRSLFASIEAQFLSTGMNPKRKTKETFKSDEKASLRGETLGPWNIVEIEKRSPFPKGGSFIVHTRWTTENVVHIVLLSLS